MNRSSIAILVSTLLLAGGAVAQVNPTTTKDRSENGASAPGTMKKGPSGGMRDGDVPSVNRRSDAAGSPGATDSSDRLSAPSGTSSSGATGTGATGSGLGGTGRQPGVGLKSSGTAGSAAGGGASNAAGSGGMGGGTTGGTMR